MEDGSFNENRACLAPAVPQSSYACPDAAPELRGRPGGLGSIGAEGHLTLPQLALYKRRQEPSRRRPVSRVATDDMAEAPRVKGQSWWCSMQKVRAPHGGFLPRLRKAMACGGLQWLSRGLWLAGQPGDGLAAPMASAWGVPQAKAAEVAARVLQRGAQRQRQGQGWQGAGQDQGHHVCRPWGQGAFGGLASRTLGDAGDYAGSFLQFAPAMSDLMQALAAVKDDLPPSVRVALQSHMEEDAKMSSKGLHKLVSQQGQAKKELLAIRGAREQFLQEWASYIGALSELLEKQLQAKAENLRKLEESEEKWMQQLHNTTRAITMIAGAPFPVSEVPCCVWRSRRLNSMHRRRGNSEAIRLLCGSVPPVHARSLMRMYSSVVLTGRAVQGQEVR